MSTKERLIIETLFRIPNKQGVDVDFMLNSAQQKIDTYITGRDLYPKARQEGVSTYFLARYLAVCLSQRNAKAVVISHDKESTQRLLSRAHYMLANIRGPKAVIKTSSKNEITFPKTGSHFYIGTAGAKKFGRGDTITHLHCSEVAYWEGADDLITGLFSAVPIDSGEIAVESTGNGVGNWYYRTCMRAAKGSGRFKLHFLDWLSFPEYDLALSEDEAHQISFNLDDSLNEPELVRLHHLTAGQLKFRRMRLEEMDYNLDKFKQEYPITLDECFQATGRSIFTKVNYVPTHEWVKESPDTHILQGHPRQGGIYSVGADVSAGIGQDASTIEVFDLVSLEQVLEYHNDRISPDVFGHKIAQVGMRFNEAFITVENNNHGIVTLKTLKDDINYPIAKLYARSGKRSHDEVGKLTSLGFRTTATSKPFIIGKLRKFLAQYIVIHSSILSSELSTFIETEEGKLQAEEGCFDDCVIGAAMAMVAIERATLLMAPHSRADNGLLYEDPFMMGTIIKELSGRRSQFPIDVERYLQ